MGAAQFLVIALQFLYSGLTARLFSPEIFGGFALAVSAQTLVSVATTTGLVSAILKSDNMSKALSKTFRFYAIWSGFGGAIAFAAFDLLLATLFNSPHAIEYIPLMSIGVFLNPLAFARLSLIRRQGRTILDAVIFAASTSSGLAASYFIASALRTPLALATSGLFTTVCILASSSLVRIKHESSDAPTKQIPGFARSVALQNLFYYFLYQSPLWFISAFFGNVQAGLLSRGVLPTQIPSLAIANALNRPLQPIWARLTSKSLRDSVLQALEVVATMSFALFGLVAACSSDLVTLWLGSSWYSVTQYIPPLAIFAAAYVPYSVAAAALEMSGELLAVRQSQYVISGFLLAAYFGGGLTHSLPVTLVGVSASQVAGLAYLIHRLCKAGGKVVLSKLLSILITPLGAFLVSVSLSSAFTAWVEGQVHFRSSIDRLMLSIVSWLILALIVYRWLAVVKLLKSRTVSSRYNRKS
jgi:PST family polysaccharide transporter